MSVTILTGDCRELMLDQGPFDLIIADPPYGDTSLDWDRLVVGWERVARERLKLTGSMWVFGSFRYFMKTYAAATAAGLKYAQEIVWEKHNGSGFHVDRFKRVHEFAVQFYRSDAPWASVYNDVQRDRGTRAPRVRRKSVPRHLSTSAQDFVSEGGSEMIMRSVIYARSCHGSAIHPTQKPVDLLEILVRTSCPRGGLVGDFFAGSGAAGDAARAQGRNYIGCEYDAAYADAARARLAALLPLEAAA